MDKKEKIKEELNKTLVEAQQIIEFLLNEGKDKNYSFHLEYQSWYTKSIRIVEKLAPDRYDEFKKFYEIDPRRKSFGYGSYVIQDYIKGIVPSNYSDFNSQAQTLTLVYNQYSILASLVSRIDNVLSDIETTLLSEIQEDELSSAKELMKVNLRAAGALCGVIIEGQLQKICKIHKITIRKMNPGIGDLNELLKQNNVYETTTWRKISYLGDIRNICSHKKDIEPTKEQVLELIEGTNWVMKNIN